MFKLIQNRKILSIIYLKGNIFWKIVFACYVIEVIKYLTVLEKSVEDCLSSNGLNLSRIISINSPISSALGSRVKSPKVKLKSSSSIDVNGSASLA